MVRYRLSDVAVTVFGLLGVLVANVVGTCWERTNEGVMTTSLVFPTVLVEEEIGVKLGEGCRVGRSGVLRVTSFSLLSFSLTSPSLRKRCRNFANDALPRASPSSIVMLT